MRCICAVLAGFESIDHQHHVTTLEAEGRALRNVDHQHSIGRTEVGRQVGIERHQFEILEDPEIEM